jgi:hypothetical protein
MCANPLYRVGIYPRQFTADPDAGLVTFCREGKRAKLFDLNAHRMKALRRVLGRTIPAQSSGVRIIYGQPIEPYQEAA